VRHLRGFAPVGGGSEHAGRPRQAAPSPPTTTTGTVPPGTHLQTVLMRLLDDRSRRKQRQTTPTIATMKCYFPCSRRLIIIFSQQENAPPGRAWPGRAASAAGRRRRSRLGRRGLARSPGSACFASRLCLAERALPPGGRFRIHCSLGHTAAPRGGRCGARSGEDRRPAIPIIIYRRWWSTQPSICATWRLSSEQCTE